MRRCTRPGDIATYESWLSTERVRVLLLPLLLLNGVVPLEEYIQLEVIELSWVVVVVGIRSSS